MKTVCEINMCAGCMLCKDICPQKAITIKDDYLCYNAIIDENKCVSCKLCENKCPQNQTPSFLTPFWYKQGWSNDEEQRKLSSSGGVAFELITFFLKSGGAVCSCLCRQGKFVFDFISSEDEIHRFRGSKYIKSNPEGIYKKIKEKINNKEKVLFIGLPCQAASVISYVGISEYLYTVDLICHGTPSPNILHEYLKQKKKSIECECEISFRKQSEFRLFIDGKPIEAGTQDNYTTAFLNSLSYTDNCYRCRYARFDRVTDITLGDSWDSDLSEVEVQKGISLILCQTEKGISLIENSNIKLFDVDIKRAVRANHQLDHPSVAPKHREYFLKNIRNRKNIDLSMLKVFPKREVKNMVKRLLSFLRRR